MDKNELEEQLVQKLTEGEMESPDTAEAARKRLPIKSEIRITAKIDPVLEETKLYRQMADEVDGRYNRYNHLIDREPSEE